MLRMDDDAFEIGKAMTFCEPAGGTNRGIRARFDTSMALFQRLVAAHGGIRKPAFLLFDEELLDVVTQRALIAFEREHVVGLPVDDLGGDLFLTPHHGGAMQSMDASIVTIAPLTVSRSSSSGIAVISLDLSATLRWPSTIRWRLENAEIMWIGALAPPSW